MPVLLLVIVLLLGACSAEKKEKVAAEPEDTKIVADEVVEVAEESHEDEASEEVASKDETPNEVAPKLETSEEEGSEAVEVDNQEVESDENWSGRWMHESHPDVFGQLLIFDETDEYLYFTIRILQGQFAELPMGFALKKDDNTAILVDDKYGCEIILHKEDNQIRTEQKGQNCYDYHGEGASFNATFTNDAVLVIDENFPKLLRQGKFSEDTYAIGSDYDTIVAGIGEAIETHSSAGAIMKDHPPLLYVIDYFTESGPVTGLNSYMFNPYRPEYIQQIMGEPEEEGISAIDGDYLMHYIIEDKYKVFFEFDPDSRLLTNVMMNDL